MKTLVCKRCQTTFSTSQTEQSFCSRKCAFASRRRTLEERFWEKVDKSGGDESCWLWTASTNEAGYGRIGAAHGVAPHYAHRLSWEWASGQPVPHGFYVCHHCDTPRCVNPAHLYVGLPVDNTHDMLAKGREQRGEGHAFATVNGATVSEIRRRLAAGERRSDVASAYGISRKHLYKIEHRLLWAHVA